jgi:hypothetical protein
VALCFLSGEKEADYDWAMSRLEEVITAYEIPELNTRVTD